MRDAHNTSNTSSEKFFKLLRLLITSTIESFKTNPEYLPYLKLLETTPVDEIGQFILASTNTQSYDQIFSMQSPNTIIKDCIKNFLSNSNV